MKFGRIVAALLLLIATGFAAGATALPVENYKLVWSDEHLQHGQTSCPFYRWFTLNRVQDLGTSARASGRCGAL